MSCGDDICRQSVLCLRESFEGCSGIYPVYLRVYIVSRIYTISANYRALSSTILMKNFPRLHSYGSARATGKGKYFVPPEAFSGIKYPRARAFIRCLFAKDEPGFSAFFLVLQKCNSSVFIKRWKATRREFDADDRGNFR